MWVWVCECEYVRCEVPRMCWCVVCGDGYMMLHAAVRDLR